ncbi:hypothetical protein KJS94_05320 [Flavihumibacter rivuli]|uniref:hypothetical protein n=1 Tax=Flavihumibacter rivuli TaxID=2838156 RepID=UPI001BDF38FE|nr:hypothetical protein [Flavihumibacter rivuli]ULQ57619.1 hypothetical protein KJS94_05320 [Flavihumibacter rivuli]
MAQLYRLLRNNKESGPYPIEELISMRLKAYDLVWVEGKSASWRYPCEINELKSHAPVATDDLYQQYFHPAGNKAQTVNPEIASPVTERKPAPSPNASVKLPETKYVAVILPGNEGVRDTRKTFTEAIVSPERDIPATKALNTTLPIETASLPLKEEGNFKNLPPSGTTRKEQQYRLSVAAALLILLVAGIYFGAVRLRDIREKKTIGGSLVPDPKNIVTQTTGSLPLATNASHKGDDPVIKATSGEEGDAKPIIQTKATLPTSDGIPGENYHQTSFTPLTKGPALEFAALRRFIDLRTNKVAVGLFGGISGIELDLSNTGPSDLNEVVIAVDYFLANRVLHHTEIIRSGVIPSGQTVKLAAPSSSKGVAIKTRVIGINGIPQPS